MNVTVMGAEISEQEKQAYIEHVKRKNAGRTINELEIHIDGDFAELKYSYDDVPFQRIRRITGYLVGTLDRFNDAKRQEVQDRVKHGSEVE